MSVTVFTIITTECSKIKVCTEKKDDASNTPFGNVVLMGSATGTFQSFDRMNIGII